MSVPLRRRFPAVALAVAAALVTGWLGVPWPHALIAGLAIVAFHELIELAPAFRPHASARQPVPAREAAQPAEIVAVPPRGKVRYGGPGGDLTARELEIAVFVAQGMTNREIAERLVLSDRTIDNHVQHVMDKLGVHRRTQITKWVVEEGLLSRSDRMRV